MKNPKSKFNFLDRIKSFSHAINGLKILLVEEHNARIHCFTAICAIVFGIIFNISIVEWIAILLCIGFVIAMEIINASIENMANFISLEKHNAIKKIKDLAAAAVLVGAVFSFIIGLLIFLPKIIALF